MHYLKRSLPARMYVTTGLMLFALFFGAGNLIFPAQMGQLAGDQSGWAMLGFIITGAGIPLLGVAVMAYAQVNDAQSLGARVFPLFGLLLSIALYLSIGPLFAAPRTATVAFQAGLWPLLRLPTIKFQSALLVFTIFYFGLAYWLSISPSKLVDRIGRLLTPALLLGIAILTAFSLLSPMSDLQSARDGYTSAPFAQGFLAGYHTMDALVSIIFALIVINIFKAQGIHEPKAMLRYTLAAGVVATLCLALVYAAVSYMGATSVGATGILRNGADVLSFVAHHYLGDTGHWLLFIIILLACLSTAIGLIVACAEYFHRLLPWISYRQWAFIMALVSAALANKGLEGIIEFSLPTLFLLYPVVMALITLGLLHAFFHGSRIVYVSTMMTALAFGALDATKHAMQFSDDLINRIDSYLPFFKMGFAWLLPTMLVFVLSALYARLRKA